MKGITENTGKSPPKKAAGPFPGAFTGHRVQRTSAVPNAATKPPSCHR